MLSWTHSDIYLNIVLRVNQNTDRTVLDGLWSDLNNLYIYPETLKQSKHWKDKPWSVLNGPLDRSREHWSKIVYETCMVNQFVLVTYMSTFYDKYNFKWSSDVALHESKNFIGYNDFKPKRYLLFVILSVINDKEFPVNDLLPQWV